jgi:hypothetical protein
MGKNRFPYTDKDEYEYIIKIIEEFISLNFI